MLVSLREWPGCEINIWGTQNGGTLINKQVRLCMGSGLGASLVPRLCSFISILMIRNIRYVYSRSVSVSC